MKLLQFQAAIGSAILLLSSPCDAKNNGHLSHLEVLKRHDHKRAHTSPRVEGIEDGARVDLKKRGVCTFPTDAGLVAVTPGSLNAGWAMSPDQACTPNSFCPYACPPGKLMAQWSPAATSYTYPESMAGGLYCDKTGAVTKPFPDKPYCVDGTGALNAQNKCGKVVAFCQTVLPGNEAMLISTSVTSSAALAVPGTSYWCSTAAHYYINPPGYSTTEACVWSDGTKPIGNWSPYVAGANTDSNGNTFVKIGWNPIWTGCSLSQTLPTFGIKIECSGSGCNGLPCSIDPSVNGMGGVTSSDQASGAGGANFCVVTVPSGQTANIVVFNTGSSSSSAVSSVAVATTAQAQTSTSSTKAVVTTSTSAEPTTTSTTALTSTSASSTVADKSSTSAYISSNVVSTTAVSSFASSTSLSASPTADNSPHVFLESNSTSTSTDMASNAAQTNVAALSVGSGTSTSSSPVATTSKKSSAPDTSVSGSMFSFLIVFAFASYVL